MSQREQKKALFIEASSKKSKTALLTVVGAVFVAAAIVLSWMFVVPSDNAGYVEADNGKIAIGLSEVDDGQAHYFKYRAGNRTVSFFLLQSNDGVIRAAFDACDVCFKALKGYRQEGDEMVCNNCNQRFQSNMINVVKGGCNPAPLTRNIVDGNVVLHERELIDGLRYFPTNG